MRIYRSIIRMRFLLLLQYRAAVLAGVATQVFWGLVRVMIFAAFYSLNPGERPMTFAQTVTYVWLGQALLGLQPWNADGEIINMIRNGNIAYELCRPVDIYNQWYCRLIALRTAPTLLRAIPIFLFSTLLLPQNFRLQPPTSMSALGAFLLAVVGALLVSCAISNLVAVTTLWTIEGDGITGLLTLLVRAFSGMIVPLPLFPEWLQPVLKLLPFAGLADTPFRFYTGNIPAGQIPAYFLHQLIWTLIFILLGRYLLSRAMKRVVIQGG